MIVSKLFHTPYRIKQLLIMFQTNNADSIILMCCDCNPRWWANIPGQGSVVWTRVGSSGSEHVSCWLLEGEIGLNLLSEVWWRRAIWQYYDVKLKHWGLKCTQINMEGKIWEVNESLWKKIKKRLFLPYIRKKKQKKTRVWLLITGFSL